MHESRVNGMPWDLTSRGACLDGNRTSDREYRAVRKKFKNFLDMCKNPEVCCELALQPINAFELDAAILFSDILTIPDAFGLGVRFEENIGPVFQNPIESKIDKGKGPVSTVLISNGKLKRGDFFICGDTPDKVCDRISDMVVDTYLSSEDPATRVACETLTTTNKVVLAGEVRGPEINKILTHLFIEIGRAHV